MREGVGDIRRVTLLITLGGELTHMRGGDPDTGGDMGHIKGGAGANSQSINRGYTFYMHFINDVKDLGTLDTRGDMGHIKRGTGNSQSIYRGYTF